MNKKIASNIDIEIYYGILSNSYSTLNHWIGLRENLQEAIDFPIKYGAFRLRFSLKPIH